MNRRILVPLAVVPLMACSSGSGTEPDPTLEVGSVVVVSGRAQVGWPERRLPNPLVAEVRDTDGAPMPDAVVTWSVASGGGSLDVGSSVTGANGRAQASWTLGRGSVDQAVLAQAGEATAAFFPGEVGVTGHWQQVAPLPEAVRAPAAATDGSRIFLFGGADANSSIMRSTQIFDPATGSWSEGAQIPIGVVWSTAVHISGRIHLLGGVTPSVAASDGHWIYDIGTDGWSSGPALPAPAAGAASALVGGVLVVAGGIDAPTVYSANVHLYDPTNSTWDVAGDAPEKLINWQAASINGRFLVTGGTGPGRVTSARLYEYDPTSDDWAERAPLPRETEGFAGTEVDGMFCVIGGRETPPIGSFNTPFDDVECFDEALGVWLTGPRFPERVQESGAADLGDALYVMGGWLADETVTDAVYRLPRPPA